MSMRFVVSANMKVRRLPSNPSKMVTPTRAMQGLAGVEAALSDHLVDDHLDQQRIGQGEELHYEGWPSTSNRVER